MTTGAGTLPTDYSDPDLWSAGSHNLVTADVNAISSGMTNFLLGSDMDLGSIYGNGSPGTSTEIGVCNIPAGACDQWICVVANVYSDLATESDTPPNTVAESYFDLLIGESGSEVSKYDAIHLKSSQGLSGMHQPMDSSDSQIYFYTPSSAEKSAGFQVQLKGRISATNASGIIFCKHIFVFGV